MQQPGSENFRENAQARKCYLILRCQVLKIFRFQRLSPNLIWKPKQEIRLPFKINLYSVEYFLNLNTVEVFFLV